MNANIRKELSMVIETLKGAVAKLQDIKTEEESLEVTAPLEDAVEYLLGATESIDRAMT